jgi:N utilization substance protein B
MDRVRNPEARSASRRRRAREIALQVLFSIDMNPMSADEALRRHQLCFADAELDEDGLEFVEDLVRGAADGRGEIDAILAAASRHWRVSRMAMVDRNLLRLATFELLRHHEIPQRVTLNEAVELARTFGSGESRAFVNGVIDRVAAALRKDEA